MRAEPPLPHSGLGQALRASCNGKGARWRWAPGFTRRDRIGLAPTEQAFFEHPAHLSSKRARTRSGKLQDRNARQVSVVLQETCSEQVLLLRKERKVGNDQISDDPTGLAGQAWQHSRDPLLVIHAKRTEGIAQRSDILPEKADAVYGEPRQGYVKVRHVESREITHLEHFDKRAVERFGEAPAPPAMNTSRGCGNIRVDLYPAVIFQKPGADRVVDHKRRPVGVFPPLG